MVLHLDDNGLGAGRRIVDLIMFVQSFCRSEAMALSVLVDDLEVVMFDHGVGALAHEVVLVTVEGGVVRVSHSRAPSSAHL